MVTGPQVSLEMKNRHSGSERGGREGRGQRLIQAVWKLLLVTKGPGSKQPWGWYPWWTGSLEALKSKEVQEL